MYLLLARHSTGHGVTSDVVQVSSDAQKIVGTARKIEELGYQFYDDPETGVTIVQISEEHPYRKEDFKYSGNKPPKKHPLVYTRNRTGDGSWGEEQWLQSTFKKTFDGVKEGDKEADKIAA